MNVYIVPLKTVHAVWDEMTPWHVREIFTNDTLARFRTYADAQKYLEAA